MIVREWKGNLQRVTILNEGFAWDGATYGSLSQVAKAITGINWNGHRFFGLRKAGDVTSGMAPDARRTSSPLKVFSCDFGAPMM